MPSSVNYNGQYRVIPGGITKVNANQLNPVTPGVNSALFLIGEAEGGQPGTIFVADEPQSIADEFVSGDIVDAANVAFQPSNDPLIPGGASRIYIYKTNSSTSASVFLPSAPAATRVSSTVTSGSGTTLVDSAQVAGSVDDQYKDAWIVLRPLTATTEVKKVTGYTSASGTFTVGSAWSSNPVAADQYLVLSDTVNLVDKVASGSSTTTVATTSIMVAGAHVGRWIYVHRVGATPDLRRITTNTTNTITVSPSLPAAPTASAYIEILANSIQLVSKNYGTSQNGISVDLATSGYGKTITVAYSGKEEIASTIGGATFLNLLFKGALTAVSDTVAANSTTSAIKVTSAGLTPSAHVGKQVSVDGVYTIITANTNDTLTVSPALPEVPSVGTVVEIKSITRATAKISGVDGKATTLTTNTGVSGADLSITFSAGMTLRQLISQINLNPNYVASAPSGINMDTTLCVDFDYGWGTEKTILLSGSITAAGFMQNVAQMVNYFNGLSQYVNATRITGGGSYDGSTVAGDIADPIFLTGAVRGTSTNSSFQAGMDAALTVRANSVVPLIDQDMINEGFGSTATIGAVAAQLLDHVVACRGAAGSERGGFIGFQGTKTEIIAQAHKLNDMDVQLVCQNPTILNALGNLEQFGPKMLAVMAAGCRGGSSEVGTALTHKLVKVAGLTQDSSWDASLLTDANDMIKSGVLFVVSDENNVFRWVRDITTWVADNNLAYSEASIRDEVRYVAYNLRKGLVDKFTGLKATPATITNIKDAATKLLEEFRSSNIIVDSTDLVTGETVKAYTNLKVTASGDVVKLSVCISPTPSINFVLNDITLKLATQAA